MQAGAGTVYYVASDSIVVDNEVPSLWAGPTITNGLTPIDSNSTFNAIEVFNSAVCLFPFVYFVYLFKH